jgi:hypothetical protein
MAVGGTTLWEAYQLWESTPTVGGTPTVGEHTNCGRAHLWEARLALILLTYVSNQSLPVTPDLIRGPFSFLHQKMDSGSSPA